jgi:copper chaperone CopZ
MATELTVSGMTCEGCEEVVEKALELDEDVESADADRHEGVVSVEGPAEEADLVERIRMAGYDAS